MAKNNQVGNKKPNVFRRFGNFLGKSASELKKVTWPSFATVVKNTGIVLAVVIFFTLIIGAADFGPFRSAQSAYGRVVKIGGK